MTREESIQILRTRIVPTRNWQEIHEAIDMAIEALSADAEYADLPDIPRYYYERIVGNMVHEINTLKEQLESADAVQGEWIHDGQNFKGGLDWCHCSVCGQKTSTNGLSMYNYCPNCGARMKGGAE